MGEGERYETNIQGNVSGGQIATGRNVTQTQTIVPSEVLQHAELEQLRAELASLRAQVVEAAPPGRRAEAEEVVAELEETLTTETPDPSKVEYVKGWIARHAPAALGTVSHLIAGPLVGKLVEAAGDAVVAQFKSRFGG